MKRKILALVLAFSLVLSTLPAFAGDDQQPGAVEEASVSSAPNPLVVSGGSDGIKYVSLGDSMAFGFGLGGVDGESLSSDKTSAFYLTSGSYPDLIQDYLKEQYDAEFFQGSVCGTRILDELVFLDRDVYEPDSYHSIFVKDYFFKLFNDAYNVYCSTIEDEIKSADFITITAGGNDTMSSLLLGNGTWLNNGDESFFNENNLAALYGKKVASAYILAKKTLQAQATLLGDKTKNKVDSTFKTLDTLVYLMGGFVKGEEKLLDRIHELNPHAVIAVTGMPNILNEYIFKMGEVQLDVESVFTPMVKVLNDVIKNAAEERSSYVRYIDILNTEHLPLSGQMDATTEDDKYLVDLSQGNILSMDEDSFWNFMSLVHPSYNGHTYIANEIMKNFKFQKNGTGLSTVKNTIANLWTTIMSKIGIKKVTNLISTFSTINFAELTKNMKGLTTLLGGVLGA